MSLRVSATGILATAGLILTCALAGAAAAATAIPTQITGLTNKAWTVSYAQPTMTLQGDLVQRGAAHLPVAAEQVTFMYSRFNAADFTQVGSATTDVNGHFAATFALPGGGVFYVSFAGDTAYSSSRTQTMIENASTTASRVSLDPLPAVVPVGTSVTFTGKAEIQSPTGWQPLPGAPLGLTGEGDNTINSYYAATSAADGTYKITVPAAESEIWHVSTVSREGSYFSAASSPSDFVHATAPTRIRTFTVPSRSEAHNPYYVWGTAERWNGTAWEPIHYVSVRIYYRPRGSKRWYLDVAAQTDLQGSFSTITFQHLGANTWQARILKDPDSLPSASIGQTDTMLDQTWLTASKNWDRGWITVNGQATDWTNPPLNFSFRTPANVTVKLYYQRTGSSTWHYLRSTKTGHDGFYSFTFTGPRSGYRFRTWLPTQSVFLGSTSRTV